MNYIEECLQKFKELPLEVQDFLNSKKVISTLNKIEEKFNMDLSFAIILIFIEELSIEDLPLYIEEKYQKDVDTNNMVLLELDRNILSEFASRFADTKEESDYLVDLSPEEKREFVLSVFTDKILDQFRLDEDHIFRVNAVIFEQLGENKNLLDKLIKLLLENQERLSTAMIVTNGESRDGTVSNWIKDFIADNGSDFFTPIALAKYLTSSKNVSALKSEEKQLLRQILKIYRNLAFFPDSMGNAPYKDWEIFPVNRDLLSFYSQKKLPKEIVQQPDIVKDVVPDINEIKEKASSDSLLIKELKLIAKDYPKQSLERKAIEDEIDKIKNKK